MVSCGIQDAEEDIYSTFDAQEDVVFSSRECGLCDCINTNINFG